MSLRSLSPSHKALWFIAIVGLSVFLLSGRWYRGKVIDGDVISYYSYLPAVFVHGDLTMRYSVGDNFYADKVWGVIWKENSGPVQKYTMGLSWLYSPFFLLGHASAYVMGYPADGYSAPYMFWIQASGVFYLMLGLFWLRGLLLRYYSERVTAAVLVLLALGSNLFYYALGQSAMPHVYLFALVSGLLWTTVRWYESPNWGWALAVGSICSLITLVRPNHLLLWSIPLLYGLVDRAALRTRVQFWRSHAAKLLLWPLLQCLMLLPQLYYWRLLTDHWIYYSYGDESFFWAHPLVGKVLFSFRNGWLIYSPLMALGLVGLVWLRRQAREWTIVAPLLMVVGGYVISCWWCWWYGGSFGNRVFIDFYPLLAMGMAALLTRMAQWTWRTALRRTAWGALAFLVVLNLFQTFQFTRGIIHYDSMTAEAYLHTFGRDRRPQHLEQYLEAPDYEAAKQGLR